MENGVQSTVPDDRKAAETTIGIFQRFSSWINARPTWRFPLVAFLSGALLTSTFSPLSFFPAAFVSFPLMIFLIDRVRSPREAFSTGWWAGFGLFSIGLTWIGHSFTQQDNVPVVLAPFAILALAGLMSLYIAMTFWLAHRFWVKGPWRILLFVAVWMLFEYARGFLFSGFPWHLAGTMWADWLSVAQIASYTSIYGLSALTLLAAASPVAIFGGRSKALGAGFVLVPLLVLGAGTVWGQVRLAANETEYDLSVSMRLVQANIKQHEKWIPSLIDDHFNRHMRLSRSGSERGKAEGVKLLIWPEAAVQRETFDRESSLLRWRMSRLLDFGSYVITGTPRYERTPGEVKFYNSLVAFNSRGQLYARYDKVRLVPFGEYMPFKNFFNSIGLSELTGSSFEPGGNTQTIALPGVPPFSPLICYEIIFPGTIPVGQERPGWLLNVTNDGWFGLTNGPYQHLALARFRAIEEGLPIVRSANTGVSAIIDSYGRTVSSLGLDQAGVLDSPLPRAITPPVYSTGFKMMMTLALCLTVILCFIIVSMLRRRNTAPAGNTIMNPSDGSPGNSSNTP